MCIGLGRRPDQVWPQGSLTDAAHVSADLLVGTRACRVASAGLVLQGDNLSAADTVGLNSIQRSAPL